MSMLDSTKRFDDFYTQGKVLGEGAFAKVYKCNRKSDNAEFAVKVVLKNFTIGKNKDSAFDIELRINQTLSHNNLVNLHDVYEKPKLSLIFDLCKGGDLLDDIEKRQVYAEADAASAVYQILEGTAYINSQNIIHRDLKPENLLLTETGTIKIADFGLAIELDKTGFASGLAGTPFYIAPEIVKKKNYNTKADAWSNGTIMYILLCGYPPFEGDAEVKAGKVFFYDEEWEHISRDAKTLIKKLLEVKPEKRISNQDSLVEPWLLEIDNLNKEAMAGMMSKLKAFNAKRKLKAATKAIMAGNRLKMLVKGGTLAKAATAGAGSAAPAVAASTESTTTSTSTTTKVAAVPKGEVLIESKPEIIPEPAPVIVALKTESIPVQASAPVKVEETKKKKVERKGGLFSCCR